MDIQMSEEFEINSSIKKYSVGITQRLSTEGFDNKNTYLLVDALVLKLWPILDHHHLIAIDATEQNKTLETAAKIIEKLRALGANRDSHLIAIGGGIIQDLATFVASTYMRGISWRYYPTTMLGMCDSCIGGKSSLNVGEYKNIAGNFYPPSYILVATELHQTLQKNEVIAGLFEAVKICFAATDTQFEDYLKITGDNLQKSLLALPDLISLSLKTKKQFIEEDEFDEGVRLLLNFGHTFGHAIEGATNYAITHGVAVGLGMLCALHCASYEAPLIEQNLRVIKLKSYIHTLLTQTEGISESLKTLDTSFALKKFKSDKKHKNDVYIVIAPNLEGYLMLKQLPKNQEADEKIMQSFQVVKDSYEIQ